MKESKAERKLVRQFLRDYLVISVVPVVALVILSVLGVGLLLRYADTLVETLALDLTADAEAQLRLLGQEVIRNRARDVAGQIEVYLNAHPDATIADLQASTTFRNIAQQPVGDTGYTAVHEAETDIIRFHTNPELVNEKADDLAERLPDFWVIFHTPEAMEHAGYYDWPDENTGELRRKYMVVSPVEVQVEGVTLMVAATTYIDEFSRPMQAIRAQAEQAVATYDAEVRQFTVWGSGVMLLILLLVLGSTHLLGRRAVRIYIQPIHELAEIATDLIEGEGSSQRHAALVAREDEIGVLARVLDQTTSRVRELLSSLEARVAERTAVLERQSMELQAAADVGHAASTIFDPDLLIWQVADLIQERFGIYHVGILLVDETGEWIEYHAGSGAAGRLILEQGLRLEVGGRSMIGWCAARARPRVAQDVREEEHFIEDPNLPHTRSEAVMPLVARGQVIGVLDVQSDEVAAFDEDVLVVLETIADQVAVALDNARLYAKSQEALATERRAYSEVSREAWTRMLQARRAAGYLRDIVGNIQPVSGAPDPAMIQASAAREVVRADETTLVVPVMSRDQVLGVARLRKPEGEGRWTDQEMAVVQTLTEQLGVALESARLYQDTQKAAARERMTGEISSRIRQSLDMDTVLQVAVREIGDSLGLSRVKVRMVTSAEDADTPEGPQQG